MGFKLIDDTAHGRHRNIQVFRDGLVALRLPMLPHNFASQVLRQFFDFILLSTLFFMFCVELYQIWLFYNYFCGFPLKTK